MMPNFLFFFAKFNNLLIELIDISMSGLLRKRYLVLVFFKARLQALATPKFFLELSLQHF